MVPGDRGPVVARKEAITENDMDDHDRLIRVETEVHIIKQRQESFEAAQAKSNEALHTKVDTLTRLVQGRMDQERGARWLAGIVASVVTIILGFIVSAWDGIVRFIKASS